MYPDEDAITSIYRQNSLDANDIDKATSGLCGTFALALYRYLRETGVRAELTDHPNSLMGN